MPRGRFDDAHCDLNGTLYEAVHLRAVERYQAKLATRLGARYLGSLRHDIVMPLRHYIIAL